MANDSPYARNGRSSTVFEADRVRAALCGPCAGVLALIGTLKVLRSTERDTLAEGPGIPVGGRS